MSISSTTKNSEAILKLGLTLTLKFTDLGAFLWSYYLCCSH